MCADAFGGVSRATIMDRHHPGEGRGPIGKVAVTERCTPLATLPNWAPAFAGVVLQFMWVAPQQ